MKFNNRVKGKSRPALWKIAVFLTIALVLNMTTIYQVQAQGINDYFQLNSSIIGPSQTQVTGSQVFTVRVTGSAITKQNLPIAPSEARITGQIVAQNNSTGAEAILNPSYVVTITPFPSKVGDTYTIDQLVNLQFPSDSPSGDYTVIGKLLEAKVFVPILGGMDVSSFLPRMQSIGPVSYSANAPVTTTAAPTVTPIPPPAPNPTMTPTPAITPVQTPTVTSTPTPTPINVITPVPTPVSGIPQQPNSPVMLVIVSIAVPMIIGGTVYYVIRKRTK